MLVIFSEFEKKWRKFARRISNRFDTWKQISKREKNNNIGNDNVLRCYWYFSTLAIVLYLFYAIRIHIYVANITFKYNLRAFLCKHCDWIYSNIFLERLIRKSSLDQAWINPLGESIKQIDEFNQKKQPYCVQSRLIWSKQKTIIQKVQYWVGVFIEISFSIKINTESPQCKDLFLERAVLLTWKMERSRKKKIDDDI